MLDFLTRVFVLASHSELTTWLSTSTSPGDVRRRKLASGEAVEQLRYVLNWRDPRTGSREQRFFERQKDAQEKRAELIAAYERGAYSAERKTLTVADAVAAWLDGKRGVVRPNTFASYEFQARYVTGPLLPADARLAIVRSGTGAKPNARPLQLFGHVKAQELTTRHIRAWHKLDHRRRSASIPPIGRWRF